jgi:hypothetical protein
MRYISSTFYKNVLKIKPRFELNFFIFFSYSYQYIFIVYNVNKSTQIKVYNYTCTYKFHILCIELHVPRIQNFVEVALVTEKVVQACHT